MKVKNISPVERHAEKIVLAVAAAATAYLVWASFTIVPSVDAGGQALGPGDVERQVTDAVNRLKDKMDANRRLTFNMTGPNYVEQLEQKAEDPLPSDLLAAVPDFAPRQLSLAELAGNELNTPQGSHQAVVFSVPPVQNLKAEPNRDRMLVPVSAGSSAGQPGAADAAADPALLQTGHYGALYPGMPMGQLGQSSGVPTDLSWVKLSGTYPVAELRKAMSVIPNKYQRVTFYRVDAQRQDITNGPVKDWTDVKPGGPVQLPPVQLLGAAQAVNQLNQLDSQVDNVLHPPFYDKATPVGAATQPGVGPGGLNPSQQRTGPGGIPPEIQAMIAAIQQSHGAPPGGAPGQGTAVPPIAPFNPQAGGRGFGQYPGATAQPGAVQSADKTDVWFYDTGIEPGHTYRYRLRVQIYNPEYGVAGAKSSRVAWLDSPWTELETPVAVSPNRGYFIVRGIGGAVMQAEVWRWIEGRFESYDQGLSPGQAVGQDRYVPDVKKEVDFTTGVYVVDPEPFAYDSEVVLMNPSGNLVLCGDQTDSPERKQINEMSAPPKPTTQPAVNPAGRPGTPFGTPAGRTPRNNRRIPTPPFGPGAEGSR